MSVEQVVNERLAALTEAGTSIWLDQIRRTLITSGELERLIRQESLRGVTSNPAIFEKAILGSTDYDDQIEELARAGVDSEGIYEEIAIKDVQLACDVFRPLWEEAGGGDGFVSLEVGPSAAHDTEETMRQARDFWKRVDRPNLMIKIPGTTEGVPAIEEALYEGINVNITLLFAVESYENVMEAYLKAMERRRAEGKPLDVRSVASFFVSRVDTEVDKRLDGLGRNDLRGTAAVANARAAYRRFKEVFGGERYAALREAGCPVQRPLWASTGVKDPHYPETKYVATLVGPDTVNTMPMPTLLACKDELEVTPGTAEQDPTAELQALTDAGIDSTDPGAVLGVERAVDLETTLFIVSSKSGGTVETLSHMRYFYERAGRDGSRFVAVTDPGSPLVELARERGFRHVFENDPEIGGRHSVLSYFGLVPAVLAGVNIEAMLHRAQVAEQNCGPFETGAGNSGLWLGLAMGQLALLGRDKATFIVSHPIESFGLWVEQLIAESTGKDGKGILPVAGEPLGDPDEYGDDRVFAYLRNPDEPDADLDAKVEALARAGHPTVTMAVHGAADLGRIFFFAEFATAVAGWVLGINAFNQPNVQEAKDNTNKVLASPQLPEVPETDDLEPLLAQAKPPHYVAIMGYVTPSEEFDAAIAEVRTKIRARTKATTTFGYGPRFLHSTGQLHKGGPPTGLFLQLVHDGEEDVEIPEAGYTFGHLKNAQATGDYQTLSNHGLPVWRVRLEGDAAEAVRRLV